MSSSESFLVVLRGGPPWGFRIKEGHRKGQPIKISTLNSSGKAAHQGAREGDIVLAVNGQPVEGATQAHKLMKETPQVLTLTLSRGRDPEIFRSEASLEVKKPQTVETAAPGSPSASLRSSSSTSTGSTTIAVNNCSTTKTPSPSFLSNHVVKVWTPGQQGQASDNKIENQESKKPSSGEEGHENEAIVSPSVWQPFGGGDPEGKPQFRSVKLESQFTSSSRTEDHAVQKPLVMPVSSAAIPPITPSPPPQETTSPLFTRVGASSGLPQYQNPTITLLQKAREGRFPKGANYIDDTVRFSDGPVPQNARLVDQKVTFEGDRIHTDSYYALPYRQNVPSGKTVTIEAPTKYEGIGPTEKGIPIGLRTGVKEEYQSDWYKTMFKSLNKVSSLDGRVPHTGGYMSEPEFERDDDQYSTRYATLDYRRRASEKPATKTTATTEQSLINPYLPAATSFLQRETYRNQPRSIAEYEPGHSSIAEKESRLEDSGDTAQQRNRNAAHPRLGFIDGYESDSKLIRKTGKTNVPDPVQQKAWYREIQKGGEIPFSGLGKTAPEKSKEPKIGPPPPPPSLTELEYSMSELQDYAASPHRYQEKQVNIHFRSPIHNLEKEYVDEAEIQRRQEKAMRRFYEEEKHKKQMQQVAEIEMRRHGDNFMPSQKSPIPLNRYDNPFEISSSSPTSKAPELRSLAKVLYNFTGQTAREISLNKGDIVYITRKVDGNWYEGEHHGLIGIFPVSYVEAIPTESAGLQPRKVHEGHARAKFSFRAQTPVELSLFKGESVVLTRKVDRNWYEGRIGSKKGIFPAAYVEVLTEPGESTGTAISPKPAASPVYSPIVNGSSNKQYRTYQKEVFSSYPQTSRSTSQSGGSHSINSYSENLHVDTYSEPIPYRALYSYHPQNDDELELQEGDTIYVMEKCDDGWYVGTSLRSGLFGTFPGNYVERI